MDSMQLSFLSIVKTIRLLMGQRSPFSSTDHGESQRWRQDSAERAKWTFPLCLIVELQSPGILWPRDRGYLGLKLQDLDLHVFLMRGLPGGMAGEFY